MIQNLNAKVASLEGQLSGWKGTTAKLNKECDSNRQRIHALEEALRFYADPDHWAEYRGTLQPRFHLVVEIHHPWDVAGEAIRVLNPPSGEAATKEPGDESN